MLRLLFVALLALCIILWTPVAMLFSLGAKLIRLHVKPDSAGYYPTWCSRYDDIAVLPISAMAWFLTG